MKKIRIGLVGLGGIMTGIHIPGYKGSPDCCITAICDIDPKKLQTIGDMLEIPEENRFLRYEDLLNSDLIDAVDIATPDAIHCPVAAVAAARGIPFSVEKPMGMNYAQVKAVADAAKEKNLTGTVCLSWHYNPMVRLLRDTIQQGKIGELMHIYIRYLKDSALWEGRRLDWRFDANLSASGVMGDLGSHMFDIAEFIGGRFESLCADAGIFVKERKALDSEQLLPVTTWDWCNVLAKMENNVNATFEISRSVQSTATWMEIVAAGDKGKIVYSWNGDIGFGWKGGSTQTLYLYNKDGATELIPDESDKVVQSQVFLNMLRGITDGTEATLADGLRCQAALDAAFRSVQEGRWVTMAEIETC